MGSLNNNVAEMVRNVSLNREKEKQKELEAQAMQQPAGKDLIPAAVPEPGMGLIQMPGQFKTEIDPLEEAIKKRREAITSSQQGLGSIR